MKENTPPNQDMRSAFRMPSIQTMVSRKSSITNAFVSSLVPVLRPSNKEIKKALEILEISCTSPACAYCGDSATEWDHLRPLVKNRRPTGYISEIGNLVPCCGKCNQSKGNKDWETWMRSNARYSPANRGIFDLEKRIHLLHQYESWHQSKPLAMQKILGQELWDQYWIKLDNVIQLLTETQCFADKLRDIIKKKFIDGTNV